MYLVLHLQGIPADPEKRLVDFLLENMLTNINVPNDPVPNEVVNKGWYIPTRNFDFIDW